MPRRTQHSKLVAALAELNASYPTNIRIYHHQDLESASYAEQIFGALVAAGYNSRGVAPLVFMRAFVDPKDQTGISVADEPHEAAVALHAALNKGGIPCRLRHLHMHAPHERGPSERQGPERFVGTSELLLEVWPEA